MICSCYRTDPPSLLAALAAPELLDRYLAQLAAELPALADRALVRHLRQLAALAAEARAEGLERLAARDQHAADALLTDLFAVATWHGWELPLEALGERELPVEGLPRGLLGADRAADGAHLWVVDEDTVALARCREPAAEVADQRPGRQEPGQEEDRR